MSESRKILILSANPAGTVKLRLDEECREIKEGLRRSKWRDLYRIETAEAVRYRDIHRAILDHEPNIVHFCGHGAGEEGLVFEDETGRYKLVSAEALAGLFELFADRVDCVVLNACYSRVQAEAIAEYIDEVIGMSKAIGDRAAIEFAVGFYDAIGAGKDFEFAYKLGCNTIQMAGIPEHLTPQRLTKGSTGGELTKITEGNNEDERAGITTGRRVLISEMTEENNEDERTEMTTGRRIFISYRSQEPDASLAKDFHDRLKAAGHEPFLAAKSIEWGENWVERVDRELKRCDYFLLLLSEQSATSDMVAGEVRTARELRNQLGKPVILPIRVNLPFDASINYELRSYLQTIQQKSWRSPEDTPVLVREILALIDAGTAPEPVEETAKIPAPTTVSGGNRPPLPVADLELPGGKMPLDSEFYVAREPWDSRCWEQIRKRAGLVRIKAPRQMGKTSLLARIGHRAREEGYQTAVLDFLEPDEAMFESSSVFLKRFCALVSDQLGIAPQKITEFWNEELFGPKENCRGYIERYVLKQSTEPLFLGIDELDRLFPHGQVAKEFLMLLRSWNGRAIDNDSWAKLRIAFTHSTESYVVLDINYSPFNVGLAVDLPEFTPAQVRDLATRHGLNWNNEEIERLMAMVGGHPYLVRLALYTIAQRDLTLDRLLEEAPTDAGIFGEHLRRHLWNLQQHPELAEAFRQVIFSDRPVILEPILAFKLNGMGLVDLRGNEVVTRHYRLYRPYFRSRLSLRP